MFPVARIAVRATSSAPHPLPDPPLFRPITARRRYGLVHYNVVVPDLPEHHRFLACMVMMGQSGVAVFDADHAIVRSPRDTATVAVGTAATAPDFFGAYSIAEDCDLRDDGSLLRFGSELELRVTHPNLSIRVRVPGLSLDLEFALADDVTWFSRAPFYDHVGILGRAGDGTLCSFEHAQVVSPVAVLDRRLPVKLPIDLFQYHVLRLDDERLLLLTEVLAFGRPALRTAFLKGASTDARFDGVACEPIGRRPEPLIAPDGRLTPLPEAFRWSGPGIDVELTPDTVPIYGLGAGWMGGARFAGRVDGRDVEGRAYYEHSDRR